MNIGFIGMGIMGSRMAMNLLEAGFDLTINNRTREKSQVLLDKGAKWAESPAELAPIVEILFTMLSTPDAAYKKGIALSALNSIKELYGLAEKQGFGRKDFAAIYALLAKDRSGDN